MIWSLFYFHGHFYGGLIGTENIFIPSEEKAVCKNKAFFFYKLENGSKFSDKKILVLDFCCYSCRSTIATRICEREQGMFHCIQATHSSGHVTFNKNIFRNAFLKKTRSLPLQWKKIANETLNKTNWNPGSRIPKFVIIVAHARNINFSTCRSSRDRVFILGKTEKVTTRSYLNGLINASTCYTILDTMPGSTIMMNAACTSSMCERYTCLKCTWRQRFVSVND